MFLVLLRSSPGLVDRGSLLNGLDELSKQSRGRYLGMERVGACLDHFVVSEICVPVLLENTVRVSFRVRGVHPFVARVCVDTHAD